MSDLKHHVITFSLGFFAITLVSIGVIYLGVQIVGESVYGRILDRLDKVNQ